MKTIQSSASVIAPAILALSLVACGKDLNTKTIIFGQTAAKSDTRLLKEPTAEALFASKYSAVNVECGYFLKRSTDTSTAPEYTNFFPVFPATKDEKITKVVSDHSDYNGQVKLITEIKVDQEANAKTRTVSYHPTVSLSGSAFILKKDADASTLPLKTDLNSLDINLDETPEKDLVVGVISAENHVNNSTDTFKIVCHLNLTPLATTIK